MDAYETCVNVLQELDKTLVHYNSLDTKSKRAWDRLKWDPDRSRTLRERLTSSVVMVNGFYSSLIHDSQVQILEALGRLERDYRGGHREESILSLQRIASGPIEEEDDEDEDAAWDQIIRDLEDVGVTHRDALEYRDFIIDWFVRAVNEGRLMEERPGTQTFDMMPQELGNALPAAVSRDAQQIPRWEMPSSFQASPDNGLESLLNQPAGSGLTRADRQHQRSFSTPVPVESSSTPYGRPERVVNRASLPPGASQLSQGIGTPAASTTSAQARIPPVYNSEGNVGVRHTLPLGAITVPTQPTTIPVHVGQGTPIEDSLVSTAQRITAAWLERDWANAAFYLEEQLAAVERGETTTVNGNTSQPDRRLLRHLIGICASYSGDFLKAKNVFESVFNGIYLNGANLDSGDISAARWLGDVCLHLHEPYNTALAWSVALKGLIARYGATRDITLTVCDELDTLDLWLHSVRDLEESFRLNIDPSDVFMHTHLMEKYSLIASLKGRLEHNTHRTSPAFIRWGRPTTAWAVPEEMLTRRLTDMSSWPLQWDATFAAAGAIKSEQLMSGANCNGPVPPLSTISLPSVGYMRTKQLHYLTKRSQTWLVETVKSGLQDRGIEHREEGAMLICRFNQRRHGFAFTEGINIKFKRIQFRSMVGLKITEGEWVTRTLPTPRGLQGRTVPRGIEDFIKIVRDILDKAETEERGNNILAKNLTLDTPDLSLVSSMPRR